MLQLYYFNHKITTPIVFFIVKVFNENEERFLEQHTNYLFQILIENGLAQQNSILIFTVIKEYSGKMINWILASKTTDFKILQQIEKDTTLLNAIITETLKHCDCETYLAFSEDKLKIQDCKINLDFLIPYFQ